MKLGLVALVYNSNPGEAEVKRTLGVCLPTCLAKLASTKTVRNPVSENRVDGVLRNDN